MKCRFERCRRDSRGAGLELSSVPCRSCGTTRRERSVRRCHRWSVRHRPHSYAYDTTGAGVLSDVIGRVLRSSEQEMPETAASITRVAHRIPDVANQLPLIKSSAARGPPRSKLDPPLPQDAWLANRRALPRCGRSDARSTFAASPWSFDEHRSGDDDSASATSPSTTRSRYRLSCGSSMVPPSCQLRNSWFTSISHSNFQDSYTLYFRLIGL